MRCIVCESLSFRAVCGGCINTIIAPSIRIVEDFKIYTFYIYSDIDFLMATKYSEIGSRVYSALSHAAATGFMETWNLDGIVSVGIDCRPRRVSYSHVACIMRAFRKCFSPLYGQLHAKNVVQYAGKSLKFRQENRRNLVFNAGECDVVIIDDIITTGTSMLEARDVIKENGGNPLFGIALCDAKF